MATRRPNGPSSWPPPCWRCCRRYWSCCCCSAGSSKAWSRRRSNVAEIVYRPAMLDEAANILAVLIEIAPEIPVQVEPLEREEALYALIRNCARSGESWVAVDDTGRIVGFLLAEPDQVRRHYAEHEIL